jgi:hypothetical protein
MIGDSGLLAGQLYSKGVTALRPQLKEHIGKRHVLVFTPFEDSFMPQYNETVHVLLSTGQFVVGFEFECKHTVVTKPRFFMEGLEICAQDLKLNTNPQ